MNRAARREDPLAVFPRAANRLNTLWKKATYPFAVFGRGVSVACSCELHRSHAPHICLEDGVCLAENVWLNVPSGGAASGPGIILGKGCRIGRRSTISARNQIVLEANVLLGPSVLIMDHNHEYSDPERPIHAQGVTAGGRIVIGQNCWLGSGAVVVCNRGELIVGRNSVVGANAVVTRSCAPYSVLAGNPAKVIRSFDPPTGRWLRSSYA